MKRGFLNTSRSKRVIEEAYAPRPPPGPEPSPQGKPSRRRRTQEAVAAVAAEDAIIVETATAVGDLSGPKNPVVAVHTTQSAEGEAELPSLDGDDDAKAAGEPKGKSKEMLADTFESSEATPDYPAGFLPLRPPPRRPGWGRDPAEDILHTVPQLGDDDHPGRKRAVFRLWPRDPNGEPLMPSKRPKGKLSPDGYPWGATLYDLYIVNRFPKFHSSVSTMTGSGIWEGMKELGELDAAESEIEWAKSECDPRVEGVAKTEVLIECIERRSHLGLYRNFSMADTVRKTALPVRILKEDAVERTSEDGNGEQKGELGEEHKKADGVEQASAENNKGNGGDDNDKEHEEEDQYMKVDPASIPPPPTIPITSPFHPSHYPKPWPFIPFANPLSILLQERIPLYLLPQKLYVHDPFNLLSARKQTFRNTSWLSRPDIVRTYDLKFSSAIGKPLEVENARRKAEELEECKARTLIVLRYKRTKEQIKNCEPVIEVPLPPYPRRVTKVEESHLYLSPIAKVGDGHHSIVYKGEWELPRDIFMRPKLCKRCFKESADKEIQRLKDTGQWEKLLRAAGWGPTGFTGRPPTRAELKEVNDPTNLERNGEIIEREVTCIVAPDASPSEIFTMVDESDTVWDMVMKQKHVNALHFNLTEDGDEGKPRREPHVPIIRIDPPFSYESCTHRLQPVPRTAKFTVVAKLSIEYDNHLVREASNYQQFPERLFHHYNGYTIMAQLHTVVPVHAVVPQFYGYYTPEDQTEHQTREPYLSPILLLEHCGKPIDPENLSDEDQEECASLLLRFQQAGWLHASVAPRNFLVQYGKPTEFPLERESNPEPSFRLIDFGRSREFERAEEKRAEELETLRMFSKLSGKMSVTFSL